MPDAGFLVACHAQPLPADGSAPARVHLLPFGTFSGRDGRGPWTLGDAKAVITATQSHHRAVDLPIDYEHQSVLGKNVLSGPIPAAGWIKLDSLEAREDGIWGNVEWTSTASRLLADKAYRYLSPVIIHRKDNGEVIRIDGAGLTLTPNLELTALCSQGETMTSDTLSRAKSALGFDGTNDDTFVSCCSDLGKLCKAFASYLGLPDGTPPSGVLGALTSKANDKGETACQSADIIAAANAIQEVSALAVSLRQQLNSAQVEQAINSAMLEGKITPGMRPWAVSLASQDPERFQGFINSMPPVFSHLFTSPFEGKPPVPPEKTGALTNSQMAVCSAMGISEDEFLKTKKG
ncbi:phage protease [Paramagnetospirillum magneticum]|uniref:Mu-like prophage I protein n=1 Tax=Paramagnetospirillum magneticum (strain ATCC 700264 / AMB-1) TaxID=342108 RepID=Q2W6I2_PARM1|nr:phage protease [Paramagnetospirillum magneticum]BAE50543.1 Mu-like prophage I protein [Paramagnetospirillum magneticum AMB-1]